MHHAFQTDDGRLRSIAEKVLAGQRIDAADGLALYRSFDILAVGWLANHVREKMHGNTTYFNVNRHINPTNVCVAACRLCAFGRKKDSAGSYTMALEEAWETAAQGYSEAVTEFHIVGGLHPSLPFSYYTDMLKALRTLDSRLQLKCFTAIEILHLAWLAKKSVAETLAELKKAGLDSLTGGGEFLLLPPPRLESGNLQGE